MSEGILPNVADGDPTQFYANENVNATAAPGPAPEVSQDAPAAAKPKEKKSWFGRKDKRDVLGIAPTGHRIHSLELIAFHKAGLGVNVVFVNDDGIAY